MSDEPSSSSAPVVIPPPVEFHITKEMPLEEVNAHIFPKTDKVPNLCFSLPNVLVKRDGAHLTIRNGTIQPIPLEHEIENWFSFEQEKDFPMGIQRQNQIVVAGRSIPVLDEKSVPTAADYLSVLGTRVLWEFSSVPLPMKPGSLPSIYERAVFKNRRLWVTLPPLIPEP